jgi:hypothetical protein
MPAMSQCCRCCGNTAVPEAPLDDHEDEVLAAATILIKMSTSHVESADSLPCTCGSLPSIQQIAAEADPYPQTDAEDSNAMSAEFLRVRAGGNGCPQLGTPTEAGSEDEHEHEHAVLRGETKKRDAEKELKPAIKHRVKQDIKKKDKQDLSRKGRGHLETVLVFDAVRECALQVVSRQPDVHT